MTESQRQALRRLVRSLYDFQRLKNQAAGRGRKKSKAAAIVLDADDVQILDGLSGGLEKLEKEALAECEKRVKANPVGRYLTSIRGIGPTLAAVFLTEIDITRARHVSSLWKYAGLDVVVGHAPRMVAKQIRPWNAFLKTKTVGVGGDCILKACVRVKDPESKDWKKVLIESAGPAEETETSKRADEPEKTETTQRADMEEQTDLCERAVGLEQTALDERASDGEQTAAVAKQIAKAERARAVESTTTTKRADTKEQSRLVERYVTGYATIYADTRHRLFHKIGPCQLCADREEQTSGRERVRYQENTDVQERAEAPEKTVKHKRCYNCNGTGVGPWGKGAAHRHRAAIRYMMKIFLQDLWLFWRKEAGLPVSDPYAVAKLGRNAHKAG